MSLKVFSAEPICVSSAAKFALFEPSRDLLHLHLEFQIQGTSLCLRSGAGPQSLKNEDSLNLFLTPEPDPWGRC